MLQSTANLLTLSQAAKLLPSRPHASTLWRWARRGVQTRTGGRIHLEHVRFGGRVYTSAEALDRFGNGLAEADSGHFTAQPSGVNKQRTPIQEEKAIAAANAELAAEGI